MIGSDVSVAGSTVFVAVLVPDKHWQRHEVQWIVPLGGLQREETRITAVQEKAGGRVSLSNGASFANDEKPVWAVIGQRQDANCRQRAEACYHRQFTASRTLMALDELDPYPGLAVANAVKKVDGKSATEIQKFLKGLDADGGLAPPVDYVKQSAADNENATPIQGALKDHLKTH
jgi:hypothetical protein